VREDTSARKKPWCKIQDTTIMFHMPQEKERPPNKGSALQRYSVPAEMRVIGGHTAATEYMQTNPLLHRRRVVDRCRWTSRRPPWPCSTPSFTRSPSTGFLPRGSRRRKTRRICAQDALLDRIKFCTGSSSPLLCRQRLEPRFCCEGENGSKKEKRGYRERRCCTAESCRTTGVVQGTISVS